MTNPLLAEVTRGGIVESRHTGSFAVVDSYGQLVQGSGDIASPIFPRSAIKAFQCLAMMESGAADAFDLSDEEIALACSSHNGEPEHVRAAESMLAKANNSEALYECGAHWPIEQKAQHDLVRSGGEPRQIHNNCSGKHAGMLALARQLVADPANYTDGGHPVQRAIARVMGEMCDVNLDEAPCGIDGCSVPTWGIPLKNMALGFARLASGQGLEATRARHCARIIAAVRAYPFMVAGTGRFCTRLMQAVPRAFVKTGAEGVFCGAVPHAGLGIALKCDDGAGRAAEAAFAAILAGLDVWTDDEKKALEAFTHTELTNWRKLHVGELHAAPVTSPHFHSA